MKKRSWTEQDLRKVVASSLSIRQVLFALGLRPSGGNYLVMKKFFLLYSIDTSHFTGKIWNKGIRYEKKPHVALEDILKEGTWFQSHKLRQRLIKIGLKQAQCELCRWAIFSVDGRLPLELDHINGIHTDNRLENLRILCPNCHSLQPTHRGRNKKKIVVYRLT